MVFITSLNAQFAEVVFDKYTTVNQLGLTVNNNGMFGNNLRKVFGEITPSCQYRQHTEILREQVEHFSYAGLWIGGIVNGERRVSTAIIDNSFDSGEEGIEFNPTSGIEIRSSISSTSDDPISQYFDTSAVSHQDMLMDFRDYGQLIFNHTPLGIDVHLETYAWNLSFADAFDILSYTITNSSTDTIRNIYAGIWVDAIIVNANYTDIYGLASRPFYGHLDGFDETLDGAGFARDIAYEYDADGDDGWSESYLGVKMLGGTVPRPYVDSYYHQWMWSNNANTEYPAYSQPRNDIDRYETMISSVPIGTEPNLYTNGYPNPPDSWLFQLSSGPLGSQPVQPDSSNWVLPPGESCEVVFAIIAARWNGPGVDGEDDEIRRENLYINADWAQKAYNGEDENRNNILDDGEDGNGNDILDRYILPEPPPSPNTVVKVGDRSATIYWSNEAEEFIDPVSKEKDFEGYRIYGARKTVGDETEEFTLLGDYDIYVDSVQNIGYNTGLEAIQIKIDTLLAPIMIDGWEYQYKFENTGINNGWLNYYSVTAYDRGDPEANLASLESSVYTNRTFLYPGTIPGADSSWVGNPTVYPNPYRGQAKWDGYGNRERMIWFQNLPQEAEIRIFTLAGDLVDVIQHSETYRGEDVNNINSRNNPILSGGEHAWDMISRYDQAIASGLYLFTVENIDTHKIKEGKFLIIK